MKKKPKPKRIKVYDQEFIMGGHGDVRFGNVRPYHLYEAAFYGQLLDWAKAVERASPKR